MPGGKRGFVVSTRPRRYKELPQQKRLREATEACGITRGMPRAELVEKMKTCIPAYFAKIKEEKGE